MPTAGEAKHAREPSIDRENEIIGQPIESLPDDLSRPRGLRPLPNDTPGSHRRWWLAIVAAGGFSLPFAWLLAYAAMLPFYLGVFFFMLFGLLIGATVYRIASPGRPYRSPSLVIGTTLLVAFVFGFSLVKESRDFPASAAERVSLRKRDIGDRSVAEHRRAIADDLRRFLSEKYPPGGVSAYVRWALTDGRIKPGDLTVIDRGIEIPASQTRIGWAIRVVLSIAFLGFGIGSQTLSLHRSEEPGQRRIAPSDEVEPNRRER